MSHPLPVAQKPDTQTLEFVDAVQRGLGSDSQKTLPSRYLYDAIGSSLFEVITLLPEYGVTRADERLIGRHAPELADHLGANIVMAELGSGNGVKTHRIISALTRKGPLVYMPIDVSASALDRCQRELENIEGLDVQSLQSSYFEGLRLAMERTPRDKRLLLLFLGGTIGNFDRPAIPEFLKQVRSTIRKGDAFLLGTDIEKPTSQLLAAYDDALGVTAAFNLNILARINRELDGNFDLVRFEHLALYNESERRIEMHLRALSDHVVRIAAADLEFNVRNGETIWTESSHKFNVEEIGRLSEDCGFRRAAQWLDVEWSFAETLLIAD
jgi:L-histidine N-alpha-methyltransferase